MRRLIHSLAALSVSALACGTSIPLRPAPSGGETRELDEFLVTARRPMQEIGVQKTDFDSIALKESIALSIADVLAFNSSLYVKSYGRATLSTVAFRGTSPSHTSVTWNGIPVNSPMLGMTDFSTIPSFFIDQARLLHGSSSIAEAGGGLGGAVSLSTAPDRTKEGVSVTYTQGIGSFKTFDEFLRFSYNKGKWYFSTRAVYSSSANDFTYINRDKKLNIYDDDHNIIEQYHPKEKNRSGSFKDFHIMQEAAYDAGKGDRLRLSVWYTASNRELPMLTTDYGEERGLDNRQRENTVRGVAGWRRTRSLWNLDVSAGYVHTWMGYDYRREVKDGVWSVMTKSRSLVNSFSGKALFNWFPADRWLFTASLAASRHDVKSEDHILSAQGTDETVGYHKARLEGSGAVTARWQPVDGAGIAATLREELYGGDLSPVIPALFADWKIIDASGGGLAYGLTLKASGSRNYRYPTLNDLYFMPGGNPGLDCEKGWSYDCGADFQIEDGGLLKAGVSAAWFDSRISDWIIWLPTVKGFFSPRNMKKVHAYGVEVKGNLSLAPHPDWTVDIDGSWSWTPSVNVGEAVSEWDKSVGKQLPYIPRHSGSATLRVGWRSWGLLYKLCAYARRYTMTSNEVSPSGDLPAYSVSNLMIEKSFRFRPLDLQLKLSVNNLFNAEYMSVLSRPMPGTNFEFFVTITPKWRY